MTGTHKPPDGSALSRWSRLKHEAAREKPKSPAPQPEDANAPVTSAAPAATEPQATPRADVLPPVESLTIDSDFSAFLQPKVDAALKRRALKQLFRDPHFNVMDGLDIYIDDYSQPDPIAPEIIRQMVQGRYIFDPPPTRINAQGFVEDVPAEELAALEGEPQPAAPDAQLEPRAEVSAAPEPPAPPENAAPEATAVRNESGTEPPSTDGPGAARRAAR